MKYTIKYSNIEENTWCSTNKRVKQSYCDCIETDDIETCKDILKDYVDPPDYQLTDEDIRKNYGEKISESSVEQIRNFYSFRKHIYGDFLEDLKRNVCGIFRYEFPEEINHFEVAEDAKYDERQIEYYIELKIEK